MNALIDTESEPGSWSKALASPSCSIPVTDAPVTVDVFTALRSLLCHELRIDADKVTEAATFAELGADSLDRIHLTAQIEHRFNIEIPDDVAEVTETVGDTVAVIERRLGK